MPMTIPMLTVVVGRSNSTPSPPCLSRDSASRASVAMTEGFIGSETYWCVRTLLDEEQLTSADYTANLLDQGGSRILLEESWDTPAIILSLPAERKVADELRLVATDTAGEWRKGFPYQSKHKIKQLKIRPPAQDPRCLKVPPMVWKTTPTYESRLWRLIVGDANLTWQEAEELKAFVRSKGLNI